MNFLRINGLPYVLSSLICNKYDVIVFLTKGNVIRIKTFPLTVFAHLNVRINSSKSKLISQNDTQLETFFNETIDNSEGWFQ